METQCRVVIPIKQLGVDFPGVWDADLGCGSWGVGKVWDTDGTACLGYGWGQHHSLVYSHRAPS